MQQIKSEINSRYSYNVPEMADTEHYIIHTHGIWEPAGPCIRSVGLREFSRLMVKKDANVHLNSFFQYLRQIRLESGEAFGPKGEGQAEAYGSDLVKMSLAKNKAGRDPIVHVNGGPQSPADSGFHGRGANVPSVAESNSTTFDEDYPSDVSYEQSMVESIGPSVSQRGTVVRYDSSTPSSPWLSPHASRRMASGTDSTSTPPMSEVEDGHSRRYRRKVRRGGAGGGSASFSLPNSATSSPLTSSHRHHRSHHYSSHGSLASGSGSQSHWGQRYRGHVEIHSYFPNLLFVRSFLRIPSIVNFCEGYAL